MGALQVRNATAADAEAIAELVNDAFLVERFFVDGDRTNPAAVSHLLETGTLLLAEVDGRLTITNIQLRCSAHNQYEGELFYGHGRPAEKRTLPGKSSSSGPRVAVPRPPEFLSG